MRLIIASVFTLTLLVATSFAAQPITELRNCTYEPTNWADGDSFRIRTSSGTPHTIRLYGADCIEWHITNDNDARRLRGQRRYFGIAECGNSPKESIDAAKAFGNRAAEDTANALAEPFTVRTAFADARGDGKHKRVYAFVTTAAGEDLAERLIRRGLARAFGVYRETSDRKTAKEYQELLRDVELLAAKKSVGIWAKTDWDRLPGERQEQRKEEAELDLAAGSDKVSAGILIDPNTAARDELMQLPGIGEATANRIIGGRPYKIAADLLLVEGIGPKTLERLKPFLMLPGGN